MKLKLDEQGHAVLQDGKPVYVKDDGKEIPVDVPRAFAKIGQLTGESAANRKGREEVESRLKAFDGIEDPAKALEALRIVANLDAKKQDEANEFEKIKADINKSWQSKFDEATNEAQALKQKLHAEMIRNAFANSKYIIERLAIPVDMALAYFGRNFCVEDDCVIGKDNNGQKLYSGSKPGELADVDESMEILVDQYHEKDRILKGTGASGGGATGGGHGGNGVKASLADCKTDAEKVAYLQQRHGKQ